MAIKWKQIEKNVNHEGTTITYYAEGFGIYLQSRKRHIPHSNREGTWDHTTYWLLVPTVNFEKEFWRMKDAKDYAEQKVKEAQNGK